MATKKPAPGPASDPEVALIRAIAEILAETGLSEIELDRKGTRVRVSRGAPAQTTTYVSNAPPPLAPAMAAAATVAAAPPPLSAALEGVVKSPMVGTAFRAPAPGTPNFIEVGAEVKQGQTLIIIEAMKTMNQIPAPRAGKVTQVLVTDRQPLEFGEPICVIE